VVGCVLENKLKELFPLIVGDQQLRKTAYDISNRAFDNSDGLFNVSVEQEELGFVLVVS